MIAAGLILLAIGAADLLREFLPARARWIALGAGAVVVIALAASADAIVSGIVALGAAALWVWLAPVGAPSRAGFWPAVALGVLVAVLVAVVPGRAAAGVLGHLWELRAPVAGVSFDEALLALGAVLFLFESANVVVRTALMQEKLGVGSSGAVTPLPASEGEAQVTGPDDPAAGSITPLPAAPALKGGRLIGPLERLLVFSLTLAGVYSILAAILAAKGIVRFPEISRDSEAGNRAEYFLVGSLVSWVVALAAAFLVWWALAGPV